MIQDQAQDLSKVHLVLNPKPLDAGSKFYVDVSKVRSRIKVTQKFIMMFQDYAQSDFEGEYLRLLLAGHRSSGKSTEISIISQKLSQQYFILNIDDIETCQGEISDYSDLLYFIAEALLKACAKNPDMTANAKEQILMMEKLLLEKIYTKELQESSFTISGGLEGEAGTLGGKIFAKVFEIFARLRAKASFEEETRKRVTREIKNTLSSFMELFGDILLRVQEYERGKGKQFLLIIDGLDKISSDVAENIFLSPDSPIRTIRCHMLLTFPLYLCYSCQYTQAVDAFHDIGFLSMIKVHQKDGSVYPEGVQALTALLEKRMALSLFEDSAVYRYAIAKSGGILRDLFKIIAEASLQARYDGRDKIAIGDVETAYCDLKSAYERSCTLEDLAIFREVSRNPNKELIFVKSPKDTRIMDLFQRGLLIEYNGERWCDNHPAVEDILRAHNLVGA